MATQPNSDTGQILERLHALREPPSEPAPDPTPAPEPAARAPEPDREPPGPSVEPAPAETSAEPAPEPAADEDEGAITLESIDDLASHLGVEVSDLYNLQVPMTDDTGKTVRVSLADWKDGYKAEQTSRQRQKEYERLTAELRGEQQRRQQEVESRLQELQSMLKSVEGHALAGLDDASLERMRMEGDPDYAVKLTERMRREQQLAEARRAAEAEVERLRGEQHRQNQQALQETVAAEREALLTQPEFRDWKDPEKWNAGSQRLAAYARAQGFSDEELGNVVDHRALRILEKARLWDENQGKASAARKQVLRIGAKVAKPGATISRSRQVGSEVQKAKAALQKSGNIADAARLLQAQRRARQ